MRLPESIAGHGDSFVFAGMQPRLKHLDIKLVAKDVQDSTDDPNIGTFTGALSVYGNADRQGDIVDPGAFTRTLSEKGNIVPLLWQHDPNKPIGELHLIDTPHSLYVQKGIINKQTTHGADAYALLKHTPGGLSAMSIGYTTPPGGEAMGADGFNHCTDLDLWEGSLVTFPANERAKVDSVKNMGETKSISSIDKSKIVSQLHDMPEHDVNATHRRLHQMAAQGHMLTGFSKDDMEWFHHAVEGELNHRATEAGRKPAADSALEWGKSYTSFQLKHFPGQIGVIAQNTGKSILAPHHTASVCMAVKALTTLLEEAATPEDPDEVVGVESLGDTEKAVALTVDPGVLAEWKALTNRA